MKESHSILVVAAHPDDEVLGCGGTIARHARAGDKVRILIMAEGLTSRQNKRNRNEANNELSKLGKASQIAGRKLGAEDTELLNLPDNRLDSVDRLDLTKEIEKRIELYQPDTIYFHHSGDLNIDHRRVNEAVITACRPTPSSGVRQLLTFEVASSTEWQEPRASTAFLPNWFVDISNLWHEKKEALEAYSSEMRPWPHARSIRAVEHLARWRGAQVGVEAAEAFCLIRKIR